ncbi:hypothetical protein [Pantoea sp. 18069]|uniref:hypothetical protein n=1 Tax=Pantoea sp. 18069 TaxID=2681415 RepID=UPI001358A22A|nr:hypothetical protein [Pantoea sp. 18069]
MNKRLFTDLLLVTVLMGAALCIARGILQSSIASFFGAWGLLLSAILIWLESRRSRREAPSAIEDTARPRTADFQ